MLSGGTKMSYEQSDKIAPTLATFASLFCHLLVTIPDALFGEPQSSLSFTLTQLKEMAKDLRDVALGLIKLAFPESGPAEVPGEEGEEALVAIWLHLFKAVAALVGINCFSLGFDMHCFSSR